MKGGAGPAGSRKGLRVQLASNFLHLISNCAFFIASWYDSLSEDAESREAKYAGEKAERA